MDKEGRGDPDDRREGTGRHHVAEHAGAIKGKGRACLGSSPALENRLQFRRSVRENPPSCSFPSRVSRGASNLPGLGAGHTCSPERRLSPPFSVHPPVSSQRAALTPSRTLLCFQTGPRQQATRGLTAQAARKPAELPPEEQPAAGVSIHQHPKTQTVKAAPAQTFGSDTTCLARRAEAHAGAHQEPQSGLGTWEPHPQAGLSAGAPRGQWLFRLGTG